MGRWIMLLLFLLVQEDLKQGCAGRPYVNDPECPRKPELVHTRRCLKKCRTDLDCKGRHKRCLCDGICGRSCVKESKPCDGLKTVFNGKYDMEPYNKFGARALYSCDEGFVLSGSSVRVCQGDGFWSGTAPTCETEGTTDMRQSDDEKRKQIREPLKKPVRKPERQCRDPLEVQHAYHDGPKGQKVFPLGMQLNYNCSRGYQINGFIKAMCVGDGRWVGPRMSCSPKRCNHPGDIPHGYREGSIFMFPNEVKYRCTEGYEMKGRDSRMCLANGQWSGQPPKCVPVQCPRLIAPTNGNMTALYPGMENTYRAEMLFSCNHGFMLNGSKTRQCKKDGTWGGRPAICPMVDCGTPGPFYNGYIDADPYKTRFGATVTFRCIGRTTFSGESKMAYCQADGKWSQPLPKCLSKCRVRSIANGSLADDLYSVDSYVIHGETVRYKCNPGHVLDNDKLPECNNGTWNFLPMCVPAPCLRRPPDITNGMVRYHTHRHGDRAKYHCNTGFNLAGERFVICLYGKWTGKAPDCEPAYCGFPGVIENGEVLLVGMMGKYEYRSYVEDIGHNKQIEFQCNKGHKRIGPPGATCVGGEWSPKILPKCKKVKHPKLDYFRRGKRSITGFSTANATLKNVMQKGDCRIYEVSHGSVLQPTFSRYASDGSRLQIKCDHGYKLTIDDKRDQRHTALLRDSPTCRNGKWSHRVKCEKLKTYKRIT